MATINGGSGNDTLFGTQAADVINGLAGNDILTAVGLSAADTLNGGDGLDTLIGTTRRDFLNGGNQNDVIRGGGGGDAIDGGAGTDTVDYSNAGAAVLVDLLLGTGKAGLSAQDQLISIENVVGGSAGDSLSGNAGQNQLEGRDGNDTLNGGNGNDTLIGGKGGDSLIGGAGRDAASYFGSTGAVTVNLLTGLGLGSDAQGDTFATIEDVLGTPFADTLIGNDESNTLNGGSGDDTIQAGGGADLILDRAGNDTIDAGSGNDEITAGAGADAINGGADIDLVSYAESNAGVNVSLKGNSGQGGFAQGDTFLNVENLTGSSFDDALTGNLGANVILGGAGNDSLAGLDGDDILDGFTGINFLIGGAGADQLHGDSGVDTANYSSSIDAVTVNLAAGTGSGGDAQGDTLFFIETVVGTSAADTLTGDALANSLIGNSGNDTLNGGDGDDVIEGGVGGDAMTGGLGIDTLNYGGLFAAFAGVTITLSGSASGGDAAGDTFSGFENVLGSRVGDSLTGDSGSNRLSGDSGNDVLNGGAGDDTLDGGTGDDVFFGGFGSDRYIAGNVDIPEDTVPNDIINENASGSANDVLVVEALDDVVSSTRVGNDLNIVFANNGAMQIRNHFIATSQVEFAEIAGQQFVLANGMIGGGTPGIISGTDGAETIDGRGGGDILYGNGGNDRILGGDGDDVIHDGAGKDRVTGGLGADEFHFIRDGARDVVTDFQVGNDTIVLDRETFGLAADAEVADVLRIGRSGAADPEFRMIGNTLYYVGGPAFGPREAVAIFQGPLNGLSLDDFALG